MKNKESLDFVTHEVLERLPHGEIRVHETTRVKEEALKIASELNKSSGRYGSSFSVHTIDRTPIQMFSKSWR